MIIDKVVLIASSVIRKGGRVLLLQRGDDSSYPNYWQLPEGKIEKIELSDSALKREVKEEISVGIKNFKFQKVFYSNLKAKGLQYLTVRAVYSVTLASNNITLSKEHKNYGWYSRKEVLVLPLIPGIKEILEEII